MNLDPSILVIADNSGQIAIAGIKGGKNPEVSEKTKIVVIESANFNPKIVRVGSKKLGLKTDASLRYQIQWSNNQTKWYYEYITDVYEENNPDGTVTFYQGNSTFSQNSGKFMRIEYYNPDTSSTNVDTIINFLH